MTNPPCPVCASPAPFLYKSRWVHQTPGFLRFIGSMQAESVVSEQPEPFHFCDSCGFIFHPETSDPPVTPVFKETSEAEADRGLENHFAERQTERYKRRNSWVLYHARPGMRALDVGSQYGVHMKMLADAGCEVTGIEPHRANLQAGVRKWGLNVVEGYYQTDSFQAGTFDLISAEAVAYYFRPVTTFMDIARHHLKPAGTLYVQFLSPRAAPMHWFANFIRCLIPPENAASVFGRMGWSVVGVNATDYQRGSSAFMLRPDRKTTPMPGMNRAEALRCLKAADYNLLPRRGQRVPACVAGPVFTLAGISDRAGAVAAKAVNRGYAAIYGAEAFD